MGGSNRSDDCMTTETGTVTAARPRRRKWVRRAALLLLILLVAVELALRLILGLGDPVIYQSDPACGYLPVPNQHVRRFFSRNDINALGMRSPPVDREKPPGA